MRALVSAHVFASGMWNEESYREKVVVGGGRKGVRLTQVWLGSRAENHIHLLTLLLALWHSESVLVELRFYPGRFMIHK